jgi:hypothetical protein
MLNMEGELAEIRREASAAKNAIVPATRLGGDQRVMHLATCVEKLCVLLSRVDREMRELDRKASTSAGAARVGDVALPTHAIAPPS